MYLLAEVGISHLRDRRAPRADDHALEAHTAWREPGDAPSRDQAHPKAARHCVCMPAPDPAGRGWYPV